MFYLCQSRALSKQDCHVKSTEGILENMQEPTQGRSPDEKVYREMTHARFLLKANTGEQGPGWSDDKIAEVLEVSLAMVERVRKLLSRLPRHDAPPCV